MKKNFTYISLFLFVILGLTTLVSWSYAELTDDKDNKSEVKVVTRKDGTTIISLAETGVDEHGKAFTLARKLETDKDGNKKLTIKDAREGRETETTILEGDEVNEYLKDHPELNADKTEKGTMAFAYTSDEGEEMTIDIDVDIEEILSKAGIHIEKSANGKHKKVIIKSGSNGNSGNSFSYSFSSNDSSCVINLQGLDKALQQLEKNLSHMNVDMKVIKDGENGYVIIKSFSTGGNNRKNVVILKDSDVYEDVEDVEQLLEKLGINADIELKDGNKKKRVIVKRTVKIEDIKEEETSNTAKPMKLYDLGFYPNPNDGKFKLDFSPVSKGEVTVTITNMNGKEVYRKLFAGKEKYSQKIDISGKSKGVYFLNLSQGKRSVSKKLIVE